MNAAPHGRSDPPVPVFTLGTALRWLGHRCFQRCSASLDELPASVSFTPLGDTLRPAPHGTLVVVDLVDAANPGGDLHVPFDTVQACAAQDGISVRAAQGTDNAPHRAALDPDLDSDAMACRAPPDGRERPLVGPRQPDPSALSAPPNAGESALFGVIERSPCGLASFGEFDQAGLGVWNVSATRLLERQCSDMSIDLSVALRGRPASSVPQDTVDAVAANIGVTVPGDHEARESRFRTGRRRPLDIDADALGKAVASHLADPYGERGPPAGPI